ncbi:hypothetical protein PENTCL1PPCAC_13095 [Pristionchus entomophagus]|uniref:Uncharacterized protein n=1 Tax=Pristionchus entomophagus TaxID=358040 RepID=A0AAV5T5X0_9BILA|nr:hypothetical protein PENTCL1PPCAC_13095 [Pristionchus entomophagus]
MIPEHVCLIPSHRSALNSNAKMILMGVHKFCVDCLPLFQPLLAHESCRVIQSQSIRIAQLEEECAPQEALLDDNDDSMTHMETQMAATEKTLQHLIARLNPRILEEERTNVRKFISKIISRKTMRTKKKLRKRDGAEMKLLLARNILLYSTMLNLPNHIRAKKISKCHVWKTCGRLYIGYKYLVTM